MSYETNRVLIPVYFALFSLVNFVRILLFRKKAGKNPIIFGGSETAHGYVGKLLKALIVFTGAIVGVYLWSYETFQRLGVFQIPGITQYLGWAILLVGLLIIAIAQSQMGMSWRIGIETQDETQIIHSGLYRFSRNPIYVGLYLTLVGLFLVIPSWPILGVWSVGHMLLQIQIRLEEAHLERIHGAAYLEYKKKVRRWI